MPNPGADDLVSPKWGFEYEQPAKSFGKATGPGPGWGETIAWGVVMTTAMVTAVETIALAAAVSPAVLVATALEKGAAGLIALGLSGTDAALVLRAVGAL